MSGHPHAIAAVRAAQNWHTWGRVAALRYAQRRGVPVALLGLARLLEGQGARVLS